MTNLLNRVAVGVPDECWPWTGAIDKDGYPLGHVDGKIRRFHRAIYEHFVGPIPEGYTVDHDCHNRDAGCPGGRFDPHRLCCNPAHLVARTSVDNAAQSPNWTGNFTLCKAGHPFAVVGGRRTCRTCGARRARESRQRRAA